MTDDERLQNHAAVAEVAVLLTLPVSGYDPTDGEPIFDYNLAKETGYGIVIHAHVASENPLQTTRQILADALAKVDRDIEAAEDADPDAVVEGFDADEVIAGLLGPETKS